MTRDQKSGKTKSRKALRRRRRTSVAAANASVRAQRSKRSYKASTSVKALRDSEARFRELADNISQFAWTADHAGSIYWYNKRWYDYTGTTLEEMQGWGWQKVHHPEHVERVVRRIRQSFETGEPWEDTFPLRGRDGTYRWFLSRALPIRNEAGDIVRWFGTNTDVSERIEAEKALRDSEARFRELAGELRALGEVSQSVNSTLDLETVLSTIVAKAVQLSGTDGGAIYVFDYLQHEFHLRATYGMDEELIEALRQRHIGLDEPNITPAFLKGEPIQVPDLRDAVFSAANEIVLRAGFRALLLTPLLRGEEIVGMLVVRRRTPGAFPQNTVDLMKTFAAQSALAIENARLFKNVETSLEDLRTAQDRLIQTEKLASLGQLTAGIAHEIKNPLNFVNNFSAISVELIDELREALGNLMRGEISEIADTLQGNLDKVVQHGKRADAIVKNMLLHSRQGSGEHRPVDINALVEESLNLAYHGARAEKQGFTITLERSFDPAAGEVDLFPQEITRALLNLISNGFYAATKRKSEANGGNYEPTLAATTKNLGNGIEIRIRDNGTGIATEVKEKLFSPFFTTKPAGEGTGLGLSISHDIIVKQHGGSIEVDTQPGEFTEFRIVLPRAGASPIKGSHVTRNRARPDR